MYREKLMEKTVLLKLPARDPLLGRTPDEFIQQLREKLYGRVSEAYIFGSFGSDRFNEYSDIDIILVMETDKPFLERPLEFSDIMDMALSMDLLVYTPAELSRLLQEDTGFWKSVKETLKHVV